MKNIQQLTRVCAFWLPVAGGCAFIVLYLFAASMYPGGTRVDHHTQGYSHMSNYWCDLLDSVSYSGDINHGRPIAVLATVILPLSLVPLWLQVPLLFHAPSVARSIVRIAGPVAMVLSTLVFTPMHDFAINLAALFGLVAFATTIWGLARMKRAALVCIGLVPMLLGITNYIMWQTGSFLNVMPMVQKAAYGSMFIWIIAVSRTIRQT
ncbi:hypothetical protein [Geomonas propionica]|uniref:DUF2029 domain-containing protein n=1 Tax=Geomonas propionica TaxID=2798582 RepID=A0ABS0YXV6_9BACT|nr:hypothetical protein [Geomonas propionica]MBJ6802688.1 hypothetical protein [Geomonas propionica]